MFWVISQFFVYYITPCVFIHTFDVSMRIYNVNSCENKEKPLNETLNSLPALLWVPVIQNYTWISWLALKQQQIGQNIYEPSALIC